MSSTPLPFDQWAETEGANLEGLQQLQSYGEHIHRATFGKDPRVAAEADRQLMGLARKRGYIDAEDDEAAAQQFFAKPLSDAAAVSDAELEGVVADKFYDGEEGEDELRSYWAMRRQPGATPEMLQESFAAAEPFLTAEARNKAKRNTVRRGDAPFATYRDEEGKVRVEVGSSIDTLDDEEILTAFERTPDMVHDARDLHAVKGMFDVPPGLTTTRHRALRNSELQRALSSKDAPESMRVSVDRIANMIAKGRITEAKREADDLANDPSLRKRYSERDVVDAAMDAGKRASGSDKPQFLSTGEVVMPRGLLLRGEEHDKMVDELDISLAQKSLTKAARKDQLEALAGHFNKLAGSFAGTEFVEFYENGKDAGKTDGEIAEAWYADEKNYSGFKERSKGVFFGVLEGFGGLGLYPMALAGNEQARKAIGSLMTHEQRRNEYAGLFGDEFGLMYDITRYAPAMAADIALSIPTAGAFGAISTATRATLKGAAGMMLRRTTSSVAKAATKAALKKGVPGSVAQALEMTGESFTRRLSGAVRGTLGVSPSAFNRSAGSSYATVYGSLEELHPEWTPQQVREAAYGHAVVNGSITVGVMSAFSGLAVAYPKVFAMGVEQWAAGHRGMTIRQLNAAYKEILRAPGRLTPEMKNYLNLSSFKEFVGSLAKTSTRNSLIAYGRHGWSEGLEEAVDQFINGFRDANIQQQDLDFMTAFRQALHAGVIGGVFGTTGAISSVGIAKSARVTAPQQRDAETGAFSRIADALEVNGDVASAAFLRNQIAEAQAQRRTVSSTLEQFGSFAAAQATLADVEAAPVRKIPRTPTELNLRLRKLERMLATLEAIPPMQRSREQMESIAAAKLLHERYTDIHAAAVEESVMAPTKRDARPSGKLVFPKDGAVVGVDTGTKVVKPTVPKYETKEEADEAIVPLEEEVARLDARGDQRTPYQEQKLNELRTHIDDIKAQFPEPGVPDTYLEEEVRGPQLPVDEQMRRLDAGIAEQEAKIAELERRFPVAKKRPLEVKSFLTKLRKTRDRFRVARAKLVEPAIDTVVEPDFARIPFGEDVEGQFDFEARLFEQPSVFDEETDAFLRSLEPAEAEAAVEAASNRKRARDEQTKAKIAAGQKVSKRDTQSLATRAPDEQIAEELDQGNLPGVAQDVAVDEDENDATGAPEAATKIRAIKGALAVQAELDFAEPPAVDSEAVAEKAAELDEQIAEDTADEPAVPARGVVNVESTENGALFYERNEDGSTTEVRVAVNQDGTVGVFVGNTEINPADTEENVTQLFSPEGARKVLDFIGKVEQTNDVTQTLDEMTGMFVETGATPEQEQAAAEVEDPLAALTPELEAEIEKDMGVTPNPLMTQIRQQYILARIRAAKSNKTVTEILLEELDAAKRDIEILDHIVPLLNQPPLKEGEVYTFKHGAYRVSKFDADSEMLKRDADGAMKVFSRETGELVEDKRTVTPVTTKEALLEDEQGNPRFLTPEDRAVFDDLVESGIVPLATHLRSGEWEVSSKAPLYLGAFIQTVEKHVLAKSPLPELPSDVIRKQDAEAAEEGALEYRFYTTFIRNGARLDWTEDQLLTRAAELDALLEKSLDEREAAAVKAARLELMRALNAATADAELVETMNTLDSAVDGLATLRTALTRYGKQFVERGAVLTEGERGALKAEVHDTIAALRSIRQKSREGRITPLDIAPFEGAVTARLHALRRILTTDIAGETADVPSMQEALMWEIRNLDEDLGNLRKMRDDVLGTLEEDIPATVLRVRRAEIRMSEVTQQIANKDLASVRLVRQRNQIMRMAEDINEQKNSLWEGARPHTIDTRRALNNREQIRLHDIRRGVVRGFRLRGARKFSRGGVTQNLTVPFVRAKDGSLVPVFDNDPRSAATLLSLGFSVRVPKAYRREGGPLNPSIKINSNGWVVEAFDPLTLRTVSKPGDLSVVAERGFHPRQLSSASQQTYVEALNPVEPEFYGAVGTTPDNIAPAEIVSGKTEVSDDPYIVGAQNYLDGVFGGNRAYVRPVNTTAKRAQANEEANAAHLAAGRLIDDLTLVQTAQNGRYARMSVTMRLAESSDQKVVQAQEALTEAEADLSKRDALRLAALERAEAKLAELVETHGEEPADNTAAVNAIARARNIIEVFKILPTEETVEQVRDKRAAATLKRRVEAHEEVRKAQRNLEMRETIAAQDRAAADAYLRIREYLFKGVEDVENAGNLDERNINLEDVADQVQADALRAQVAAQEQLSQLEAQETQESNKEAAGVYKAADVRALERAALEAPDGSFEEARALVLHLYKQDIREFSLAMRLAAVERAGRDPVKWLEKNLDKDALAVVKTWFKRRKRATRVTREQFRKFLDTQRIISARERKLFNDWSRSLAKPDSLTEAQLKRFIKDNLAEFGNVEEEATAWLDARTHEAVTDKLALSRFTEMLLTKLAPEIDPETGIRPSTPWYSPKRGDARPRSLQAIISNVHRRYVEAASSQGRTSDFEVSIDDVQGEFELNQQAVDNMAEAMTKVFFEGESIEQGTPVLSDVVEDFGSSHYFQRMVAEMDRNPDLRAAAEAVAVELGIHSAPTTSNSELWGKIHEVTMRQPGLLENLPENVRKAAAPMYAAIMSPGVRNRFMTDAARIAIDQREIYTRFFQQMATAEGLEIGDLVTTGLRPHQTYEMLALTADNPQVPAALRTVAKAIVDTTIYNAADMPVIEFTATPAAGLASWTGVYSPSSQTATINLTKEGYSPAEALVRSVVSHLVDVARRSPTDPAEAKALESLNDQIVRTFPGAGETTQAAAINEENAVRFAITDPVAQQQVARRNPTFMDRLVNYVAGILGAKSDIARQRVEEVVQSRPHVPRPYTGPAPRADADGFALGRGGTRLVFFRGGLRSKAPNTQEVFFTTDESTAEGYARTAGEFLGRGDIDEKVVGPVNARLKELAQQLPPRRLKLFAAQLIGFPNLTMQDVDAFTIREGTTRYRGLAEMWNRGEYGRVVREYPDRDLFKQTPGGRTTVVSELTESGSTQQQAEEWYTEWDHLSRTALDPQRVVSAVNLRLGRVKTVDSELTPGQIQQARQEGFDSIWRDRAVGGGKFPEVVILRPTLAEGAPGAPTRATILEQRVRKLVDLKGQPHTFTGTPMTYGDPQEPGALIPSPTPAIDLANRMLPSGIRIQESRANGAPSWVTAAAPSTIYMDPGVIDAMTADLTDSGKETVVRAIVNHEIAHIASMQELSNEDRIEIWNGLDQRTRDAVAARAPVRASQVQLAEEGVRYLVERAAHGTDSDQLIFDIVNYGDGVRGKIVRAMRSFMNALRTLFEGRPNTRTAMQIEQVMNAIARIKRGDMPLNPVVSNEVGDHIQEFEDAMENGSERVFFAVPLTSTSESVTARIESWRSRFKKSAEARAIETDRKHAMQRSDKEVKIFLDMVKQQLKALSKKGVVVPTELFNDILGSQQDYLSSEQAATLEAERLAEAKDTSLTPEERKARHGRRVAAAEQNEIVARRNRQRDAYAQLRAIDPNLANIVLSFRNRLTELSRSAGAAYEGGTLRALFDRRSEVHIIRHYRFFTSRAWKMAAQRGGQMKLPNGEVIDFDLYRAEALEAIKEQHRRGYGEEISDKKAAYHLGKWLTKIGETYGPLGSTTAARAEQGMFMEREDIPAALRQLIGEEESPILAAVHTHARLSKYLATHTMLERTAKQLTDAGLAGTEPTASDGANRVYLLDESLKQREEFAPLRGLFVDPEMKEAFNNQFKKVLPSDNEQENTMIHSAGRFLASVAGASLTLKTLGSLGFYTRNEGSNSFYFLPLQGMWSGALGFFGASKKGRRAMGLAAAAQWTKLVRAGDTAAVARLVELGILDNDVRAEIIRDLFNVDRNPDSVLNEVAEWVDGKPPSPWLKKVIDSKGKAAVTAIAKGLPEQLARVNHMIDGKAKIMLFDYELDVFRRIRDELGTGETDAELEEKAAKKVRRVMQGQSEVFQAVKTLTRSPVGLLIAPFARFKGEVVRITFETFKLAHEEIAQGRELGSKVLLNRGLNRLVSASFVSTAWTSILAGVFAALFGALSGDDEDRETVGSPMFGISGEVGRTLRSALPKWQRGHTVFARVGDESVTTIDMTYYNPLSLVSDPILRGIDAAMTDGFGAGAMATIDSLANDLVGEGIASGGLRQVVTNTDDFDQKIWMSTDGIGTRAEKIIKHYFDSALKPGIMSKSMQVAQALAWKGRAVEGDRVYEPLQIIAGEFTGVRPRKLDKNKLMFRSARNTKLDIDELNRLLGPLTSSRALEPGVVTEAVNNHAAARIELFRQHRRNADAWAVMDRDPKSADRYYRQAIEAGHSKDRMRQVRRGFVDRAVRSKAGREHIFDAGQSAGAEGGAVRLGEYRDAVLSRPRWELLE